MTFVLGAIFTIVLVVKEVVILGNFNQVCEGPFPSPFLVVWREGCKELWGVQEGIEHMNNTKMTYL